MHMYVVCFLFYKNLPLWFDWFTYVFAFMVRLGLPTLYIFMDKAESSVVADIAQTQTALIDDFFVAEHMAESVGQASTGAMPVVHDHSSVSTFLERPVLIGSFSWAIGATPYLTVNPWTAFLTNSLIKPRVSYFGRLRADLVVRYVLNGTPMHYGCVRMCYRPHPNIASDADSVFNFAVAAEAAASATNLKVVASQLSGMYINPCYNSTGELRIPYMSPAAGMELGYVGVDAARLGTLLLVGFAPLVHATGGTNPVTIDLYAHMENVVMDVPTAVAQGYTLQDAANLVRRALSATSKATAMAHEWTPRLLSAIAMLGFSRPMAHETIMSTRRMPYNLANYDVPDTCETLALSSTAELTLGGQELGCGGTDELLLSTLAARTAYISSISWDPTQARATWLFGSLVNPVQASVSVYTKRPTVTTPTGFAATTHTCLTPCAFAALTAKYWRGILSYTFTVVASPYHKGRLRIYYEPYSSSFVSGVSPSVALSNSSVLDLSENMQIVVDVPWQNAREMCTVDGAFFTNSFTNVANFAARASVSTTASNNGMIVCEVLSPLTGLSANTPVVVLVEVAVKNMVLYSPQLYRSGTPMAMDGAAIPYVPQSAVYDPTGGDAIGSLRQLVKRYSYEHTVTLQAPIDAAASNVYTVAMSWISPTYLPPPGFPSVPLGAVDYAANGELVNYTGLSFHTYVSLAFAMVRGAVRWKPVVCMRGGTTIATNLVGVARYPDPIPVLSSRRTSVTSYSNVLAATANLSSRARAVMGWRRSDVGLQLAEGSPGAHPGILDVEVPYVSALRAHNPRSSIGYGYEGRDDNNVTVTMELPVSTTSASTGYASYANVDIYTAAGEDFSVHCFVHAPAFMAAIPLPL